MKLFVFAALVTVAAAGRLEHLERSYLPPDQEEYIPLGSSFGSNGDFGAAGAGFPTRNAGGPFAGATSNQYLPPNHGPTASNGAPQFDGSLHGFSGQNFHSQQYSSHQTAPAQQYRAPQASNSFGGASYQAQFAQQSAASRQYLAPHTSSFQNPSQQAFDEETGYHY